MKILLLLSLILYSFLSYSQRLGPQKGDNLVIIGTRDSLTIAFRKIQRVLIDNGYTITSKDAEFYSLQTDYLPIERTSVKMQITVSIKEIEGGLNYITLQGKYILNMTTQGELSGIARFSGIGTGADKLTYRTLTDVARKYGGEVMYDKRQ